MKIGIPRALLYYKNEKLWTTFFSELGIEYLISPQTNKEIVANGANLAIDETCLPTKILLGHIDYLKDKCDYVFLPRVARVNGCGMCTKFLAQVDLVKNTFRDDNLNYLFYNQEKDKKKSEYKAFLKMGKFLNLKPKDIKAAYLKARAVQDSFNKQRQEAQEKIFKETKKNKVLVVAHAYNVGDQFVGQPIIRALKELDCEPIIAEYFDEKECIKASYNLTKTLPWAYNRHLVGAVELYKDKVDGIVILTTFPCGPDSMVNEMILHKVKNLPILLLTMDAQDATAGIETRLESYVDIINFKKERANE